MSPPVSSDHKAPEPGLWTAWSITWLSLLLVSLVSVGVLARLSAGGAEDALAQALGDHLEAQAGLAAQHLQGAPVALLASLGGEHSADELEVRLEGLREAGSLHDLALVGPGEQVLGSGGDWLPLAAEADLVAQAATEGVRHGALYRAHGGELFMAAYAPVPGSPGWVLAVEGSGRTLGAVEALESRQAQAGLLVVLAAGLLGALVAGLVSLPVRDLARALGEAQPGEPPVRIPVRGPREVRSAAHAAQRLLGAILERDATIGEAHSREVEQLQRLAAEIAHEVRNPLNAMGLCAERLGSAGEPDVRRRLATRLQDQVGQLEAIVAPWSPSASPSPCGPWPRRSAPSWGWRWTSRGILGAPSSPTGSCFSRSFATSSSTPGRPAPARSGVTASRRRTRSRWTCRTTAPGSRTSIGSSPGSTRPGPRAAAWGCPSPGASPKPTAATWTWWTPTPPPCA